MQFEVFFTENRFPFLGALRWSFLERPEIDISVKAGGLMEMASITEHFIDLVKTQMYMKIGDPGYINGDFNKYVKPDANIEEEVERFLDSLQALVPLMIKHGELAKLVEPPIDVLDPKFPVLGVFGSVMGRKKFKTSSDSAPSTPPVVRDIQRDHTKPLKASPLAANTIVINSPLTSMSTQIPSRERESGNRHRVRQIQPPSMNVEDRRSVFRRSLSDGSMSDLSDLLSAKVSITEPGSKRKQKQNEKQKQNQKPTTTATIVRKEVGAIAVEPVDTPKSESSENYSFIETNLSEHVNDDFLQTAKSESSLAPPVNPDGTTRPRRSRSRTWDYQSPKRNEEEVSEASAVEDSPTKDGPPPTRPSPAVIDLRQTTTSIPNPRLEAVATSSAPLNVSSPALSHDDEHATLKKFKKREKLKLLFSPFGKSHK